MIKNYLMYLYEKKKVRSLKYDSFSLYLIHIYFYLKNHYQVFTKLKKKRILKIKTK